MRSWRVRLADASCAMLSPAEQLRLSFQGGRETLQQAGKSFLSEPQGMDNSISVQEQLAARHRVSALQEASEAMMLTIITTIPAVAIATQTKHLL